MIKYYKIFAVVFTATDRKTKYKCGMFTIFVLRNRQYKIHYPTFELVTQFELFHYKASTYV